MLAASLLALWLSWAAQAIPGPTSSGGRLAVRSQLDSLPAGFKIHNLAVLPDELIRLTFAIPQANVSGLHAALLDVSDPASPNYGRHLSKQEVEQHVAPRSESVRALNEWLNSHGVTPAAPSASRSMINVRMPVKQANTLLDADFAMYIHEDTNTTMMRTLSYSLPESLYDHVNLVYPTTQFLPPVARSAPIVRSPDRRRSKRTDADVPPTCEEVTTPRCLQALYNIPATPASATNNSLYVSGFGGQVASQDDLQDFLSRYRPDVQATFDVLPVNGASVDGDGTDEAVRKPTFCIPPRPEQLFRTSTSSTLSV
ncbi:Pro-kumamolisin, activation domain-containing protein [Daedaleopsis nitida]|nr:Pro-kumamolisin, activation domain-containing protein [Daedaleopsis nitida]